MATHLLISTLTTPVGGNAYVEFTNIPQTDFQDLKITISARNTRAGSNYTDDIYALFNGDSGSNYNNKIIYGGNGGSGSFSGSTGGIQCGYCTGADGTANTFGNSEFYIFDYRSSVAKVTTSVGVAESNSTNGVYLEVAGGIWNPGTQQAISTIKLIAANGSFVSGSTFRLYGITKN
jgi:hypothetical protein